MAKLFLSFHPREILPQPGAILFMEGMAGRYRMRIERIEHVKICNERVQLTVWGTRTLVFAHKQKAH